MTQNNVGALVVVKPGEEKSIAGIITERGIHCPHTSFVLYCYLLSIGQFLYIYKILTFSFEQRKDCSCASFLSCIYPDYLRKIIVQGRSSKSTKVGDIMTEEVWIWPLYLLTIVLGNVAANCRFRHSWYLTLLRVGCRTNLSQLPLIPKFFEQCSWWQVFICFLVLWIETLNTII